MGSGPDGAGVFLQLVGLGGDAVFLCTGPLYHGASLTWSLSAQRRGATVVLMERFDAAQALTLIERHRVTHSQWVPTMFVWMLNLPPVVRAAHDLSSHQAAVPGAAPCAVDVKQAMLRWWGRSSTSTTPVAKASAPPSSPPASGSPVRAPSGDP
jgi:acyl-coenzyme A synthetase/AMP-(fatty) acid ligase